MFAILNILNAHNLPIFQPILMILVSKFMVHRALSDKTYLSLGLLSPLNSFQLCDRFGIEIWLLCYFWRNNICHITDIRTISFLYPATLKSVGYYVIPSIQKLRSSVRLSVRQRIIFTLCWEHFLTNFLQTCYES